MNGIELIQPGGESACQQKGSSTTLSASNSLNPLILAQTPRDLFRVLFSQE